MKKEKINRAKECPFCYSSNIKSIEEKFMICNRCKLIFPKDEVDYKVSDDNSDNLFMSDNEELDTVKELNFD